MCSFFNARMKPLFFRQSNILTGRLGEMTCYLGIRRRHKKRINFVGIIRHLHLLARNTPINLISLGKDDCLIDLAFLKTIYMFVKYIGHMLNHLAG